MGVVTGGGEVRPPRPDAILRFYLQDVSEEWARRFSLLLAIFR
jgi:hypothetical protein